MKVSFRTYCMAMAIALLFVTTPSIAVGSSGMYQYSVELRGYVSRETGKSPNAFLWLPDSSRKVKAVIFSQQNMAEEMLYHDRRFQERLREMDIAMVWVAPAFTNSWDPSSGCQAVFDEMMTGLAGQCGHPEIATAPIIPFGHSAQATMPWNFAAWNPGRTLCVISFHGDAPRTNLCGYGTANVEWGRTRNIDGIPGLMIEGEYEWWEARVRPALAFRMMYPESCISFLCDAGGGHFECLPETAEYIAMFIRKAIEQRLDSNGELRKVNVTDGWLAERWHDSGVRQLPAPFKEYAGDAHDAFWYPDEEMARLTEARYAASRGKEMQAVGFEYEGRRIVLDSLRHGGMFIDAKLSPDDPLTLRVNAIYTSKRHADAPPRVEVICGPARKIDNNTFRIVPYECGMDNPRRSFTVWLVAIAEGDSHFKRAVQPIEIRLPKTILEHLNISD